jgi:hypothetical protein
VDRERTTEGARATSPAAKDRRKLIGVEQTAVISLGDGAPQLAEGDNPGQVQLSTRDRCDGQAQAMNRVDVPGVVDADVGQ